MYPEICYVNSKNEVLDLTTFPYLVSDIGEVSDYSWDYDLDGTGKISGFRRGVCEVPITVGITADTTEGYLKAKDRFFAVTEVDVLNQAKGKLYYHNQYIYCNAVSSQKKDWMMDVDFTMNFVRFVTEHPFWISTQTQKFESYKELSVAPGKKYPYRNPYRYGSGSGEGFLINPHYGSSNFDLIIFGAVINPLIIIGEDRYLVNIILEEGEYLRIESRSRTITKITRTGEEINAFHAREKQRNFFEKIKPGRQSVKWSGKFDFELTIYEERSEPRWAR